MDLLLIDDHPLVRDGLRMIAEASGFFERCHECSSIERGLAVASEHAASIGLVLLDLGLPGVVGMEGLDRVREALPAAHVIVVSGDDHPATIDAAFAHGARGYVPKSSSAFAFHSALNTVFHGELYVPAQVLTSRPTPPQAPREADSAASQTRLTQRQEDVLVGLARGLANKEIAEELGMSPSTVRVHVSAILKALNVENRTQAATSTLARQLAMRGVRSGSDHGA